MKELEGTEAFMYKLIEDFGQGIDEITFAQKINFQGDKNEVKLAEDSWSETRVTVKLK